MTLQFRSLGNTGVSLSELALGTVELGMPYGFRGSQRYDQPDTVSAVRLIHRALDLGINLLDTAPAYGSSEEIVGTALRGMREKPLIATKVTVSGRAASGVRASIENSLHKLGCERLDLLQIHNATVDVLENEAVWREIEDAIVAGKVRFAGASIYDVDEGRHALARPGIRTLQLPFNLLDRRMGREIIPGSEAAGIGILVRSAFLRGVLVDERADVPAKLQPLLEAAAQALANAGKSVAGCAELALRFCLSFAGVSSVLVGVRTIAELETNVAAATRGKLQPDVIDRLCEIGVRDERLLDPREWGGLV